MTSSPKRHVGRRHPSFHLLGVPSATDRAGHTLGRQRPRDGQRADFDVEPLGNETQSLDELSDPIGARATPVVIGEFQQPLAIVGTGEGPDASGE